jgi:hypothetical protein
VVYLLNWAVLLRCALEEEEEELADVEELLLTQGVLSYLVSDRIRDLLQHSLPEHDQRDHEQVNTADEEGKTPMLVTSAMSVVPLAKVRPLASLIEALSVVPALCHRLRALLEESDEESLSESGLSSALVRELLSELDLA